MIKNIVVTRNQLAKLQTLFEQNPGASQVTIEVDHSNGIGPVMKVRVLDNPLVDITDVSNW